MKKATWFQLSFMMFLNFFIWGAWFVTLGTFLFHNLGASDGQSARVFSTQSWGAILAPFIIGLIADRYFNAERILGILHLAGAVLMFQMYRSPDVMVFFPFALLYMIIYMPTLALVNAISFRQMNNPEKEFSAVRVWGTVGWILAGLSISFFGWDSAGNVQAGMLKNTFLMSAGASLILGIFSFTLPKTPPKITRGEKVRISDLLGLDALKLLKDKNFAIFFFTAVLICIPLAFYYQYANPFLTDVGLRNPTATMSIGQVSEALFMLLLPIFFARFGFKKTILFGMLAWALRYAMFAYGNAGDLTFMLITGIALHGVCYDFFFVSGQIYTDQKAGEKYKSSAQGLITLATYGVGMLIGFEIAGYIAGTYKTPDGTHDWKRIWLMPAGFAVVVAILFTVLFRQNRTTSNTAEANSDLATSPL